MQNQRRTPRKPVQANYRRSQSRQRAQQKKSRLVVWSALLIVLAFFLIGADKGISWVWLCLAVIVWHRTFKSIKPNAATKEKENNIVVQQKTNERKEEHKKNCIYDLVVIDFETTGLNNRFLSGCMDEILSVAIIDQDGNTLLSTLCSTSKRRTWEEAEKLHGITPEMVKDMPSFSEILPKVKEILYKAKEVIAYNISFEMGFLWAYDAMNNFPGGTKIREMVDWGLDPMLMFSAYKGELSKYGDIKWQKLTTAAKHFKYSHKAHDALEDVKATLFVYNALMKYVTENDDKEYILKYGKCYKKPGD